MMKKVMFLFVFMTVYLIGCSAGETSSNDTSSSQGNEQEEHHEQSGETDDQPDEKEKEGDEKSDKAGDTDDQSGDRDGEDNQTSDQQTEKDDEATDQQHSQKEEQDGEQDIIAQSDVIIQALGDRDMKKLAETVHPDKGLTFSPYVYVTDEAVVVAKQDVPGLLETAEQKTWGEYDGKGTPIKLTPEQYFDEFMDMSLFVDDPNDILVDEPQERGNTENNIKKVFPDSKVVEYYDDGSEEYEGIDWSSINLVYEKDADGTWRLVALVRDMWTV
jgi:hypothetical protein